MRFIKITNSLKEALFDFIMEQSGGDFDEIDISSMVETAFEELGKVRGGILPVTSIDRITVNGDTVENPVMFKNAIHLAAIDPDEYGDNDTVRFGYDVVYDLDSWEIKLLYRVTVSHDDTTLICRTETDCIEDFYAPEFIISLTVQLSEKLHDGAEYIRRVCDRI